MSAADLTANIVATSRLITESYPRSLCDEAVLRRRIDKIGTEFGEVLEALNGWVGENPRKGVTHDRADVLDELLDVAACALGAYEHVDGFQGTCLIDLAMLVQRKLERLRDAMAAKVEIRYGPETDVRCPECGSDNVCEQTREAEVEAARMRHLSNRNRGEGLDGLIADVQGFNEPQRETIRGLFFDSPEIKNVRELEDD